MKKGLSLYIHTAHSNLTRSGKMKIVYLVEENPAEPEYPDDIEDWDDFEDQPPEE